MTYPDSLILIVMGGVFVAVGAGTFFKGKIDEKKEYGKIGRAHV